MTVINCYLCEQDGVDNANGNEAAFCPICHRGMCARHQSTVRWKWKSDGRPDSAKACKQCVRSYEHRSWDVYNRDWIT